MAALLLASVLISPHVLVYDLVLLAPAFFWLLDEGFVTGRRATGLGALVLAAILVLPIARVGGVPLTLPLMMWLLWRCRLSSIENAPLMCDSAVRVRGSL